MQIKPSHSKTHLKTRAVKPLSNASSSGFFLSLGANVVLAATLLLWFVGDRFVNETNSVFPQPSPALSPAQASTPKAQTASSQRLNYDQWLAILTKEAKAAAKNKPDRLMILAGDSLSLWFPSELLPSDYLWLNQGISGESSTGLLKRLKIFAQTNPQAIFVMIGINDLTKGVSDQDLIEHYSQMIKELRQTHPNSKVVMQSVLPHADESIVTAENRQQLLKISNDRIYKINRKLAEMARAAGASYLNLQPIFSDEKGFLRSELTTDGLHLSQQGYLVWRSALQTFDDQMMLGSSALSEQP
jgi:lysophospholipase L1-like esterase